jgi:hypothetical protein
LRFKRPTAGSAGAKTCASATWPGWGNARSLVLPTVRVPHLASNLLGRLTPDLPGQSEQRYSVRPLLLET